jgi:transposase
LPKSQKRSQGRHAALLLDQAGRHLSAKLGVPENITLVPLPPKCPELNPMENIWQFIRDNWISNRIFKPQTWLAVIERRRGSAQTALGRVHFSKALRSAESSLPTRSWRTLFRFCHPIPSIG